MRETLNLIAVDLGASGGRVVLGQLSANGRLSMREVHRFEHRPIHVPDATGDGAWCWDVLGMWEQIKRGIAMAARIESKIDGIGIDSWGVDYSLLDARGRLVRPPVAYRDPRAEKIFPSIIEKLGKEAIYTQTGVQFLPINTLYHLAADAQDPEQPLERATSLLMTPQLFAYWLTGKQVAEHTLASTTQIYDPQKRTWVTQWCDALDIPSRIFPQVVDADATIGALRPEIAEELHLPASTPVLAAASHDTAAAIAATPLVNDNAAYLSSGTWSLIGIELPSPLRTSAALSADLTNEAGVAGTTRLLKNVTGMWLVQECRRVWAEAGNEYTFEQLAQWASEAKPGLIIDPNNPIFSTPGDMPARIKSACEKAGFSIPDTPGGIIRCVLDSLADCYARILKNIEAVSGRPIKTLHIVGGGSKNQLLNRLTAAATGCTVVVGPFDATAAGNMLVQAIALKRIAGLAEARQIVRGSFELSRIT